MGVSYDRPTPANRERLPAWLNAEGTREQYRAGVPAEQIRA